MPVKESTESGEEREWQPREGCIWSGISCADWRFCGIWGGWAGCVGPV